MATDRLLVLVAASTLFGSAAGPVGPAQAAAPAYCALYAREYAKETVQDVAAFGMRQSVEDQAYYRCLNQDDDPPLPRASAYFASDQPSWTPNAAGRVAASLAPPTVAVVPAATNKPLIAPVPNADSDTALFATIPTSPGGSGVTTPQPPTVLAALEDDATPALKPVAAPPAPKIAGNALPKPAAVPVAPPAPPPVNPSTTTIVAAAGPDASAASVYQGSGLTPWTPEWESWCAKY